MSVSINRRIYSVNDFADFSRNIGNSHCGSKCLVREYFCNNLISQLSIAPDAEIVTPENVTVRKRGNTVFVMNFSDCEAQVELERTYKNVLTGEEISGSVTLGVCGYLVLE